jgi:ketosteroid isomerase-like protein
MNIAKSTITLCLLFSVLFATAQSKDEQQVIERTQLLSRTVFGTKDSMTMEDLFAKTATYGHSHGNLQTRQEAINGVVHNKSAYTDTLLTNIKVIFANKETAIARYLYKATETSKDGKVTPLNFSMMLVWVKEDGKWRLFGRQAISVQ